MNSDKDLIQSHVVKIVEPQECEVKQQSHYVPVVYKDIYGDQHKMDAEHYFEAFC